MLEAYKIPPGIYIPGSISHQMEHYHGLGVALMINAAPIKASPIMGLGPHATHTIQPPQELHSLPPTVPLVIYDILTPPFRTKYKILRGRTIVCLLTSAFQFIQPITFLVKNFLCQSPLVWFLFSCIMA